MNFIHPPPNLLRLCRETLLSVLRDAVPAEEGPPDLTTPACYFLRQGKELLWVEIVTFPFSRQEISDYLAKALQIHSRLPLIPMSGVLMAPEFEEGVWRLLQFVRIPIRIFRYREAPSVSSDSPLQLEEIISSEKQSLRPLIEEP